MHTSTHEPPVHNKKETGIKEYDSLKAGVASLVGANCDGRRLYLEVEVFDGEHTNRFEPEFPLDTSAEEITQYLKSIIEKNPKLDLSIVGILQQKVFYDKQEKAWFTQLANNKPQRIDKDKDDK